MNATTTMTLPANPPAEVTQYVWVTGIGGDADQLVTVPERDAILASR